MTTPYKYPALVKEINFDLMAAEYNTLIPALGIVLLKHMEYHIGHVFLNTDYYSWDNTNVALHLIQDAIKECEQDLKDAMKVYSNL